MRIRYSRSSSRKAALVKNEASSIYFSLGHFPMPFHSILWKGMGKRPGRERWGWPHSLQAPIVISSCIICVIPLAFWVAQ